MMWGGIGYWSVICGETCLMLKVELGSYFLWRAGKRAGCESISGSCVGLWCFMFMELRHSFLYFLGCLGVN